MAFVVTQEVPTSSCMAVPHGPAGVGQARHRMREQLSRSGVSESVVDDAVLILSELVSNACRHGRPLKPSDRGDGDIRAEWRVDKAGRLTVEVTDGGGPTRPIPATPSVTARGGRGLNIIAALAQEWGVRDSATGEVTVWVIVTEGHRREDFATRVTGPALTGLDGLTDLDELDDLGELGGELGGLGGLEGLDGELDELTGAGGLGAPQGLDALDALDGLDTPDDLDGLERVDSLEGLNGLDGLSGLAGPAGLHRLGGPRAAPGAPGTGPGHGPGPGPGQGPGTGPRRTAPGVPAPGRPGQGRPRAGYVDSRDDTE